MSQEKICGECERQVHARGLCKRQYEQARKKGLIRIVQVKAKKSDSLKTRLELHSKPSGNSDCILWTGYLDIGGYGRIGINGKDLPAHRVSWEIANGRPVHSMKVLHKCDVRNCINPEHLFLGTDADNVADKCAKGRQARGERNGSAKLNEEKVMRIRRDGRVHRYIARDYDVHPSTIADIKKGRTWKVCAQTD